MNDPYGLIASGLPPEMAAEAQGLTRRQAIMQAMMQQAMEPMANPTNPGQLASKQSWLAPIAQMVKAYMGSQGMKEADKGMADLGGRQRQMVSDAMAQYEAAKQGQPAIPQPPDELGGGPGREAIPGNPRKAILDAMVSQVPAVRSMGDRDWKVMQEDNQARRDQTFRAEQAQLQRQARMEELQMRLEDQKLSREDRAALQRELSQARIESARAIKELGLGMQRPVMQTITDPSNPSQQITVDVTKYKPGTSMGAPGVVGVSGKLGDAAKMDAKRAFNMQDIGSVIQEAEEVLKGPTKPTGSGVGTVMDAAGSVFGVSPSGAAEADKMRVLGGALTSKMPRMEGPQSDRDSKLYQEMAGEIGNSKLPIARRQAALSEVKRLWAKYEHLNPVGGQPKGASSSPNVRVVDW